MDSAAVEQAGATPIKATLTAIDAVNSRGTLLDEIARLQMNGVNVAFSYGSDVDAHDAAHYLGGFDRGGLGLPDRDYYTKTDPSSDSLRKAYVEHITKMLTLVGDDASDGTRERRQDSRASRRSWRRHSSSAWRVAIRRPPTIR